MEQPSDKTEIALRFINSSAAPIFLTGKAGTGKTTFLRALCNHTHKRFIVVAPTGIAALNAGGVTIHSQFLMPLGSFLPEDISGGYGQLQGQFYTRRSLSVKHPLNTKRRQILREIDLLVIDEVSMLRADLLDAMDYRLRQVRGQPQKPFGGVQMLFIGDVYQLPPIMKDDEWVVLSKFYNSPWFFAAIALRNSGLVRIELDRVWRQEDDSFVQVLNNFRHNHVKTEDVEMLNSRYMPALERAKLKDIITIVTHNYQADRINARHMSELPGTPVELAAQTGGDFPESMHPLPNPLTLKPGAQVMFVRNDAREKRYFNGMLARVLAIDSDLGVRVEPVDGGNAFFVAPETWENKKYELDGTTGDMKEEVLGTFLQYPLKPAWAITVHKSQGLTFDRAILDVGQAFAAGQVYVALSRLRSLKGLVLATRVNTSVIPSEPGVVAFSEDSERQPPVKELLERCRDTYLREMLPGTFGFEDILYQIDRIKRRNEGISQFEHEHLRLALSDMERNIRSEELITRKFSEQIERLLSSAQYDQLAERLNKGAMYYSEKVWNWMLGLQMHLLDIQRYSGTKQYREDLEELDKLLLRQITAIQRVHPLFLYLVGMGSYEMVDSSSPSRLNRRQLVLQEAKSRLVELPEPTGRKSGKIRKKKPEMLSDEPDSKGEKKSADVHKLPKPEKGSSHRLSCTMIAEGKTMGEVAMERGLAVSTIEGHINKGLSEGLILPEKVMGDRERKTLSELLVGLETLDLNGQFAALNGRVSYTKLRLMQILREIEKN